jgi:hypothetical protein
MADVVRRLHAIKDMMRPLVPLRDQVAAIETTIAEQGQQQQLMNAGLLFIERAQENGQPPNGRRHDDEEDDRFPTSHKMDFQNTTEWATPCRGSIGANATSKCGTPWRTGASHMRPSTSSTTCSCGTIGWSSTPGHRRGRASSSW